MNIAFLSSLDPTDIHSWSGTLFFMWKHLSQFHRINWIGNEILNEIKLFHYENFGSVNEFYPEKYALVFGKKLSEYFEDSPFDIIICRDYFFLAYLVTDIPVIYIGDTTFRLFNSQYMKINNCDFVNMADKLERLSLEKATHVVYSSNWAKNSAIKDYNIVPKKISVIEFGANIDFVPALISNSISMDRCNLLFIGSNWKMKGGDMAINIYRDLKKRNFPCSLTIVGSVPKEDINDNNIKIFPFINKSTQDGRQLFEKILSESHFLVAPTLFDCYGIMFCEAAAFGIPVLTLSVGGVPQVVIDGVNGFLFPKETFAKEFSDKILEVFGDITYYNLVRRLSREEYEKRLNWNTWSNKMNALLNDIINERTVYDIPLIIAGNNNISSSSIHQLCSSYPDFKVYVLNDILVCSDFINKLLSDGDEVFVVCSINHHFPANFSLSVFIRDIYKAYQLNADLLIGYVEDFDMVVPLSTRKFWIHNPKAPDFIVVYRSLYEKLLDQTTINSNNIIEKCIELAENKLLVYPFLSVHQCEEKTNAAEVKINKIQYIYFNKLYM